MRILRNDRGTPQDKEKPGEQLSRLCPISYYYREFRSINWKP